MPSNSTTTEVVWEIIDDDVGGLPDDAIDSLAALLLEEEEAQKVTARPGK